MLNFYASQGVCLNCYHICQKTLNFTYAFKCYQNNVTSKNVSWPHFSWATLYVLVSKPCCLLVSHFEFMLSPAPQSSFCESVTSSTLPEVHNVSQRRQRRTETRPDNMHRKSEVRTDRQTHRETDAVIATLHRKVGKGGE